MVIDDGENKSMNIQNTYGMRWCFQAWIHFIQIKSSLKSWSEISSQFLFYRVNFHIQSEMDSSLLHNIPPRRGALKSSSSDSWISELQRPRKLSSSYRSPLFFFAGQHCRARTRLQYKLQTESPALRVYFLLVVHSTACRWDWINANGERRERMQTETLIYYDNVSEANLNCLHFLLPSSNSKRCVVDIMELFQCKKMMDVGTESCIIKYRMTWPAAAAISLSSQS